MALVLTGKMVGGESMMVRASVSKVVDYPCDADSGPQPMVVVTGRTQRGEFLKP
jgi:hypothetical protein